MSRLYFLVFLLLFSPAIAGETKSERLYPYGGPSPETLLSLGNPYKRPELGTILNTVYSDEDTCRPWLKLATEGLFLEGRLIPWNAPRSAPKTWRSPAELPPIANESKPLENMRIAIDPGHLGGKWSAMEERDNLISNKFRVCEGVSTQIVAELLARKLRTWGAEVFLTRTGSEPATPLRPEDLAAKIAAQKGVSIDDGITREAEKLFLRRVEINARATLLRKFRPDLTICLHFDAGGETIPLNQLHFIINGSYMVSEIQDDDLRTAMIERLLDKVHTEDVAVASCVAKTMSKKLSLPAFSYTLPTEAVRAVAGEPYLWRRNLLANCLYPGPVLYAEPYAMNNELTARRMTLGDYEGKKIFDGKPYRSIYREYAEAIGEGVRNYYAQNRKKS